MGRPAGDVVDHERVRARVRARLFPAAGGEAVVTIGRFEVRERLGQGGMGVVYAARDPRLDRVVAIKLLHSEHAPERLLREAQVLAKLRHANVVAVHEVGEHRGQTFIAMELVEGVTLRKWVAAPSRAARAIPRCCAQAGRGLQAAHELGVVHRDFKPDNVLVDGRGAVRVVDFGMAGGADEVEAARGGTPGYVAPEVLAGGAHSVASDVYAFAVTVYEAFVGRRPVGDDVSALRRVAPRWLAEMVARDLRPEATARDGSMAQVLAALERDRRRPARLAALAGAIVVAAAAAAWLARPAPHDPCASAGASAWKPEDGAALARAFAATGVPYADDLAARLASGLEAYGREAAAHQAEACRAAHVTRTESLASYELRSACLARRTAALRAVADRLRSADAALVPVAHRLLADLPEIALCDNLERLRQRVAPPETPSLRAQLEALAPRLDAARIQLGAGHYPEARSEAAALAAEARQLGYRPFEADVLLTQGRAEASDGAGKAAEATLIAAAKAAQAGGDVELLARAQIRLVNLVGRALQRPKDAATWAELAGGAAEQLGSPVVRASLLDSHGQVRGDVGDYAAARPALEEATRLLAPLPEQRLAYASALLHLASLDDDEGKLAAAEAHARQAAALRESALGPRHPAVAETCNVLAVILEKTQPEEAAQLYQRAVDILEAARPQSEELGHVLDNQASVLHLQGKLERAYAQRQRALAIRLAVAPAGSLSIASSYENLGVLFDSMGRYPEATASLRKSLAIREAAHANTAHVWGNLGDVALSAQDWRAGAAAHTKALAIAEQALGDHNPSLVFYLVGLARAQVGLGHDAAAEPLLARAVRLADASPPPPGLRAKAYFVRAQLLARRRQTAAALAAAEVARAAYDRDHIPTERDKVAAWLRGHRPTR